MSTNTLYPIFLKLDQIEVLIVGAGKVGLEKLTYILKSSPKANITVIAKEIDCRVEELSHFYSNITLVQKAYHKTDLEGIDLLIVATDNSTLNQRIKADAKKIHLLTNVADKPELCDFYLGSIVTKGSVKLAISTNGKSPTLAIRLKEVLTDAIPDNINESANELNLIRNRLKGNLGVKINTLNQLTGILVDDINHQQNQNKSSILQHINWN
jgi:siroheme synthase-like protein